MSCTTHIFGTIGTLELEIDVYPPLNQTNGHHECQDEGVPLILMLHGGGFMCGDKSFHPPVVVEYLRRQGFCVISPNYPLAPCGTIFDQVEAVRLAWAWVFGGEKGMSGALPSLRVDLERVVGWGGSAGATLLILALADDRDMLPQPEALILLYPFVDLARPFLIGSLEDLGSSSIPDSVPILELSRRIMCQGMIQSSPWSDFLHLINATEPLQSEDLHPNTLFLFRCGATFPEVYTRAVLGTGTRCGLGGLTDSLSADVFEVVKRLDLPPMFVLQGVSDSVTPLKHTREFVDIARERVDNRIELVETHANGGKHVFDFQFTSAEDPGFARTIGAAVDFIRQIVGKRHGSQVVNGH